jgi:hypothetical protein
MPYLRRILPSLPFVVGGLAAVLSFQLSADSPGQAPLIIQNAGTTKGAAPMLNCDGTTITCTLSGGKVTLSAISGSAGITQLTGDVTAGPGAGSVAATVVQIEGAAIPASATVIGTNSSKQLTAPTAAAVTAYLNQFTSLLQGLVPPSGGSSTSLFLNEAGGFTSAAPSANSLIRSIGGGFDGGGSALTSGASSTAYFTVPFACTIAAWNATVDTGTITFDVWKIATGTAIPTVANTITAAALPAIASGTALHSITLTGWTTAVSANDIFGVNINTVSSATKASLVLQCNAS